MPAEWACCRVSSTACRWHWLMCFLLASFTLRSAFLTSFDTSMGFHGAATHQHSAAQCVTTRHCRLPPHVIMKASNPPSLFRRCITADLTYDAVQTHQQHMVTESGSTTKPCKITPTTHTHCLPSMCVSADLSTPLSVGTPAPLEAAASARHQAMKRRLIRRCAEPGVAAAASATAAAATAGAAAAE